MRCKYSGYNQGVFHGVQKKSWRVIVVVARHGMVDVLSLAGRPTVNHQVNYSIFFIVQMPPARACGHTHIHLTALCPGLPGWASTRKVKPIWILLKQETVSGSGISWAICKSAPRCRQITMPAPHRSVFYGPDALPATQPATSKHWRQQGLWSVTH